MYFVGTISGFLPISGILFSCYKIVSFILKVSTIGGKYRAFPTCSSRLSVVCLFYGIGIRVYLGSTLSPSPKNDVVACHIHCSSPMLNPLIYSLRNREIKNALGRLHSKTVWFSYRVSLLECGQKTQQNQTCKLNTVSLVTFFFSLMVFIPSCFTYECHFF